MPAAAHMSYPTKYVGMITLDNPPENQGSFELMERVEEAVRTVKAAGSKVVMIVSDNPKYFCPGGYLPDFKALREGTTPTGDGMAWYRVCNEMALGPMISIAVNNGIALGGGAEFNWACDIRLAGESAVYGQVEGRVGGLPGCGGSVRLPRLTGKAKAIEVLVTGRPFSAREMWHFGAVNHVYPDDQLREQAIRLAARIAENATSGLLACKQSINEQFDLPLRDALKNETRISRESEHTGDGLIDSDEVIKVYERGGDSYEAYQFEVPSREIS